MIEFIKGKITELTPAYAVIETAGGVGYLINISLPCFNSLENASSATLRVHEVIREDAWTLYGFLDEPERAMFRLLIGVSGVGANTARMILSAIPVAELEQVILAGEVRILKNVKGIGAKTAERIIVDLKDKIKPTDSTLLNQPSFSSDVFDEALSALVVLGFQKAASVKALKKLFEADPSIKVDTAIKKAMAMLH